MKKRLRLAVAMACIAALANSESARSVFIYASDHQGSVAIFDTATGSLSILGTLEEFEIQKVMGLAYDSSTESLLILDRNADSIYSMDPRTGAASLLFTVTRELQGAAIKDGLLYGVDEVTQTIEAYSLSDFSDQDLSADDAFPSEHKHALGVDPVSGQLYTESIKLIEGQFKGVFRHVSDDGTIEDPPYLISQTDFFYNDIDYWHGDFVGITQGRGMDFIDGATGQTLALVTIDEFLGVGLDIPVAGHGIAVSPLDELFFDGFESGDTSNWSLMLP